MDLTLETREGYKSCRARRKQIRMSQDKLSTLTGISQASISKFEAGEIAISFDNYFKILRAIRITPRFRFKKVKKRKGDIQNETRQAG